MEISCKEHINHIYYYYAVFFRGPILFGGLEDRIQLNVSLFCYCNPASMIMQTLVGSLCSSSASLVCCPGLDLPGSRHPHLPESKQIKHQRTHNFIESQFWMFLCSLQVVMKLARLPFTVANNKSATSVCSEVAEGPICVNLLNIGKTPDTPRLIVHNHVSVKKESRVWH